MEFFGNLWFFAQRLPLLENWPGSHLLARPFIKIVTAKVDDYTYIVHFSRNVGVRGRKLPLTSGNVAAEALIAAADSIQNFDYDFDSIYAIIFPHGLR